MDILLRPHQSYAAAYLDNLLIDSEHWEDHLDCLRRMLMELHRAGLTNPRKCPLGLSEAKYLGFQVRRGLIKPQEKKVEAVRSSPKPSTKSQVRAFLGLVGYYRCFIPNFSSLATPLTDLTRKGQPEKVCWTPEAEEAFRNVKTALTSEPVQRAPDFSHPVPDSGRWGASGPLYQQEADPGREELRQRGEGNSGHQVGSPGAVLLPPGP